MAPEPPGARDDRPGPGVCMVDGYHRAREVWTLGPPILPRRICGIHIARAVTNAWRIHLDARFRGLIE